MLALDANKVMVVLIQVLDTRSHLHLLTLEVQVLDEFAVGDVIVLLLLIIEWLNWEHVKGVDLLHLSLALFHAHLVNLATECLALLAEHLVEVA